MLPIEPSRPKVRVICVEGSHGCGKTAILTEIQKRGGMVLDEGFLDMPKLGLAPQSHTMEFIWAARWAERVLGLAPGTYFADRGVYSAVLYGERGGAMLDSLTHIHDELRATGIEIINVHVRVNEPTLWTRVQERLLLEPGRKAYKEDSLTQLQYARSFYDYHRDLWQRVVTNNDGEFEAAVAQIMEV